MRLARLSRAALLAGASALSACGDQASHGFSLPAGNADAGRQVFLDMACNDCHSVVGHEELREGVWPTMDVPLGGPTSRVKAYDDLVTSIINPSHRIAERYQSETYVADGASRMRNYNQVMTVQQLVDLVAYLQGQYDLVEYPMTSYQSYAYP
jgi:sulfur-oxidizing protein SoxX